MSNGKSRKLSRKRKNTRRFLLRSPKARSGSGQSQFSYFIELETNRVVLVLQIDKELASGEYFLNQAQKKVQKSQDLQVRCVGIMIEPNIKLIVWVCVLFKKEKQKAAKEKTIAKRARPYKVPTEKPYARKSAQKGFIYIPYSCCLPLILCYVYF